MNFKEVKRELKYFLQKDLDKVFDRLDNILDPSSEALDRLTLLRSRLVTIKRDSSSGIISSSEKSKELNILKSNTLDFINLINEDDLSSFKDKEQPSLLLHEEDPIKIKIFELLDLIDNDKENQSSKNNPDKSRDNLILRLSNALEKNNELKIKSSQLEKENEHLKEMLYHRDVLRAGIFIALSDDDFDRREADFLLNRAVLMGDKIEYLTENAKQGILRDAILMACADGEFKHREYLEIKSLSESYQFSDSFINKKIIETCIKRDISPPKSLKEEYTNYLKENGF